MIDLETAIRRAIGNSGMTLYRLSQLSGLDRAQVYRFASDDPRTRRTLTLPAASKLCRALGLELRPVKRKRKARK